MKPTSPSASDGKEKLIFREFVSAYRLKEREIITFLRRTFGDGQFHVKRSDERFLIRLPRLLSGEEKDELYRSRVAGHQLLPSDPDSNLYRKTLERESLTPLVRSQNLSAFKLPSEGDSKNLSLVYSVAKVDLSPQGVASSLYMTHISQGFSSTIH